MERIFNLLNLWSIKDYKKEAILEGE